MASKNRSQVAIKQSTLLKWVLDGEPSRKKNENRKEQITKRGGLEATFKN